MSDNPETVSDEEQRLFDLLDTYVTSMSTDDGDIPDPPEELLRAFPELADMLDCLDTLESIAGNTLVMPPSSPVMPDNTLSPQDFGRYELISEIGRGGMGIVFSARHVTLDATVALKIVRSSQFASEDEIRRFYAEARAAAGLRHPNIVSVHDVGEWQGQHFLTMDLIQGQSLAQLLNATGPLAFRRAAELLATVARAVEYLHRHQIVHRDLKPSNIMLDDEGVPHVTDFGLAKVFASDSAETVSGSIIGTPSYMSPEQAGGKSSKVTVRSDVYSMGAILYEMLTGRPPFCEDNPLDTLLQVLESEPDPPRRLKPDIPADLEALCLICLEKNAEDRFSSAAAFADELDRFLSDEPIRLQPRSFWDRIRRWSRREPALATRLAIVAAGACVVQGNYQFHRGSIRPFEHGQIMFVIAAWAITCLVCQKLMNRPSWEQRMPYVWAISDVFFLTTLLILARPGESIGPILIGYPLLVVASGLWFEKRHVWFMTAVSSIAYLMINLLRNDPEVPLPAHYPYIFAVVLWGIGYIVSYQVERIRTLSRYFERR